MERSPPPAEVVVLVLVLVPAVWILVFWLASRASGWGRVGQRFGSPGPYAPAGEAVRFASAQIGWGNYNGALEVRASPSGLYLAPVLIFRPFHPPLLIPWAEIVILPALRARGTPWLALRSMPGVRIRFSGRAWALVRRHLPA